MRLESFCVNFILLEKSHRKHSLILDRRREHVESDLFKMLSLSNRRGQRNILATKKLIQVGVWEHMRNCYIADLWCI